MLLVLGLTGCDDGETNSTLQGESGTGPMTGSTVNAPPPATQPTTQGTKPIIDPQEIPADRAGLKDHASDAKK
jgi:hypothetical protein